MIDYSSPASAPSPNSNIPHSSPTKRNVTDLVTHSSPGKLVLHQSTENSSHLFHPTDLYQLRRLLRTLFNERRASSATYKQASLVGAHAIMAMQRTFFETCTRHPFLTRTLRILEKHLDNPQLNVSLLSQKLHLSRRQLHRKLRSLTGKSPSALIREFRLYHAFHLLAETRYSVSETAYRVGFNNLSYFARCFKKQFGLLPSQLHNWSLTVLPELIS